LKRFFPLIGVVLILIFLIGVTQLSGIKLFLYNYTDSLPHGIYLLHHGACSKGDLVAFIPSSGAKQLIRERHYLREDGYLMKYLAAEKGDHVCTDTGKLIVAGENYGEILSRDKEGRDLPRYHFCGILQEGYIVAVKGKNNSFDSRYFGPIKQETILGTVTPFWLFN
jgi:conjugative transfer signal peptidase TraF